MVAETVAMAVNLTHVVWWIKWMVRKVMLTAEEWLLIWLLHHMMIGLIEWGTIILDEPLLCRFVFINLIGVSRVRSVDFAASPLLRRASYRRRIFFIDF